SGWVRLPCVGRLGQICSLSAGYRYSARNFDGVVICVSAFIAGFPTLFFSKSKKQYCIDTMNVGVYQLKKSFGGDEVLGGIDLDFRAGRVYGLVGRNGAGKTTFFNCLAGLEKHSGNVMAEGGKLKDRLGFLQTEPHFPSKLTGREYLRLFC